MLLNLQRERGDRAESRSEAARVAEGAWPKGGAGANLKGAALPGLPTPYPGGRHCLHFRDEAMERDRDRLGEVSQVSELKDGEPKHLSSCAFQFLHQTGSGSEDASPGCYGNGTHLSVENGDPGVTAGCLPSTYSLVETEFIQVPLLRIAAVLLGCGRHSQSWD